MQLQRPIIAFSLDMVLDIEQFDKLKAQEY